MIALTELASNSGFPTVANTILRRILSFSGCLTARLASEDRLARPFLPVPPISDSLFLDAEL
jgi:hypothetical protein